MVILVDKDSSFSFEFFGALQWTASNMVFSYGTNCTVIKKSQMNQKDSFFAKNCQRTHSSMFRTTSDPSSRSPPFNVFWVLPIAEVKLV